MLVATILHCQYFDEKLWFMYPEWLQYRQLQTSHFTQSPARYYSSPALPSHAVRRVLSDHSRSCIPTLAQFDASGLLEVRKASMYNIVHARRRRCVILCPFLQLLIESTIEMTCVHGGWMITVFKGPRQFVLVVIRSTADPGLFKSLETYTIIRPAL